MLNVMLNVKLMCEACHLLTVLTIFGCSNITLEIIVKKSSWMMLPLLGRLILLYHYKIDNGIGIWQIVAWIIGNR
jgi:hypothetical protein